VRVILTTILGLLCAFPLPHLLGIEARWGAAGLTISAGISSWVEFALLRRTLNRRIGHTGIPAGSLAKLWAAALAAAATGWAIHHFLGRHFPMSAAVAKLGPLLGHQYLILVAVAVLVPFGIIYFGALLALGLEEARGFLRMVSARFGSR
ncbi:MAG: hypothetical protein WA817_06850, partial [Candidatus Acidiferrum sp.]